MLRLGWGSALGAVLAPVLALAGPPPTASEVSRSKHFPFGPVVPGRPLAPWPVKTHLGTAIDLATLVRGRVTALQLMFTGCSAICPIQGALFAQAQTELKLPPDRSQFVSLSIDPLSDTPAALSAWLARFNARPGWLAVAPRIDDLPAITALLREGGQPVPTGGRDPHNGQVYLIDRKGALVFRLPSMPTPGDIVRACNTVAQYG